MITERLRSETRPHHDQMEAVGFSDKIMSGQLSLEEYKTLIRNNYIMNGLIEKAAESLEGFTSLEGLDYENRKKSALLEKDLKVLSIDQAELDKHAYTMEFTSIPQALGSYYVMEGSTLGGSVISRHLAKNENLSDVKEFNFYGCYADQVGPMWKAFQAVLIREADSKEKEDAMVQAASDTFDYFRGIFEDSLAEKA